MPVFTPTEQALFLLLRSKMTSRSGAFLNNPDATAASVMNATGPVHDDVSDVRAAPHWANMSVAWNLKVMLARHQGGPCDVDFKSAKQLQDFDRLLVDNAYGWTSIRVNPEHREPNLTLPSVYAVTPGPALVGKAHAANS